MYLLVVGQHKHSHVKLKTEENFSIREDILLRRTTLHMIDFETMQCDKELRE